MFKKMLTDYGNGKKIKCISAGVGALAGMAPTDYTVRVLNKEGVYPVGHKSSPTSRAMVENSDLIFVMERFQKDRVLNIAPKANGKVFLLREFQKDPRDVVDPEVPDPIGKPLEVYERSFELIKEGLDNLMKWIKQNGWV